MNRYDGPERYIERQEAQGPEFESLRDAIMLICPPHPGYHLEGFVVFMAWHADDDTHRRGDGLVYPAELTEDLMTMVGEVVDARRGDV